MPAPKLRLAFISLLSALALFVSAPAMADALDDALRNGSVGETARGYIAPVKGPTAAVTQLVNSINARRRAKYNDIATKNGLSLQQVESVAGSRIIQRAPAGTYVQDAGGAWRKK